LKQYVSHIVALAILLILAPASIEVDPVDISFQTLVILSIGGIFKPRDSFLLVAIYIALGALGLPVYSGYTGGYEKLIGPTAGFFIGFLLAAPLLGIVISRVKVAFWPYVLLFVLAHLVILIPGFIWLAMKLPEVDLVGILIPLLPGLFIKSCAGGGFVFGIRSRPD